MSVPSWLNIWSLRVSPLPRSCLVMSSLIVFLWRLSGVPRTFVVVFRIGIFTSMYFFLSAMGLDMLRFRYAFGLRYASLEIRLRLETDLARVI